MKIIKTKIKDLEIIRLKKISDKRGYFSRIFDLRIFKTKFQNIKQINVSMSKQKFTLRGLHYQNYPFQEDKIVTCIKGKLFDVAVDLRKNSKTYGKWKSIVLSENDGKMFFIPKGFAHGFLTLKSNTKVCYLVSQFYNKKFESGFLYNDPFFSIKWPYKPKVISKKDSSWSIKK